MFIKKISILLGGMLFGLSLGYLMLLPFMYFGDKSNIAAKLLTKVNISEINLVEAKFEPCWFMGIYRTDFTGKLNSKPVSGSVCCAMDSTCGIVFNEE